ncbi:flavoprotein [Paludibacterium denitrificans]|uniref:flavoprotein n=1 Tax=Paludibacterium denitrificans TaxID=2675226 RepID=UPI0035E45D78
MTARRILLGVTGGVAAYKAAELTRQLVKAGHSVEVVMTEAATRFVTLSHLSGTVRSRGLYRSVGPAPA